MPHRWNPQWAVAALLAAGSMAAHALTESELGARLDRAVRGDRTGVCMVAAVVGPGQVLRARACAGSRPPPGDDAAFEIGSISKTMTAFLVADLVDAGRWSLDDPIARHLPPGSRVPRQGERQILVRDLLTHSAGLPPLPSRFPVRDLGDPYAGVSEADLLASLAETTLDAPIGSQSRYSNFGMMVLSLAVARAYADEGGDLERALRARLFQPLKMDGAYLAQPPQGVRPVSGHLSTGAPTPAWTWAAAPNAAGVGGVRARLDDMVRYAQAHLGLVETPLAGRLAATRAPLAHGYGMNWLLASVRGHALVLHEGGTGGFSTLIALEPAARRAVVVLADTAFTDLGGLGPLALSLVDDDAPVLRPRRAVPMPAALRAAMVGEYTMGGMPGRVWDEGGRLLGQVDGQPPLELLADDRGDLYPAAGISALLTPVVEDGVVTRFAWRQGGGVLEGVRKGAQKPLAAQNPAWAAWAGEYRLLPQFSLRVFEDAGRLMVQGTGQRAIAAEVVGADEIAIRVVGATLVFQRNAQGEVVSATLKQNGRELQGPKQ